MKKNIFTFLLLLLALSGSAQEFIGDSRKAVMKKLVQYLSDNRINGKLEETASAISLSIQDTNWQKTDFIYFFNVKGACFMEKRASCDSCIRKYLNITLSDNRMRWNKLNATQYIAPYRKNLALVLETAGNEFTVIKTNWTRNEYAQILAQSKF